MPRFSANLSTLFTELPLLERVEAARQAGFDGIEIQFPYEIDAAQWQAALDDAGLPLALINFPAGDLMRGGEGYAAIPERQAEFRDALEQAADYAAILRPRAMNLLSGRPHAQREPAQCLQTLAANLGAASTRLRPLSIRLVTEAINSFDQPGFLLPRAGDVIDLIERIPQAGVMLQFDIYHAQRMGDDPAQTFAQHTARIGHVQFADAPGRGEPGSGILDFASLFAQIDTSPYAGFVGAEYFPTRGTADSLEWLYRYRRARK